MTQLKVQEKPQEQKVFVKFTTDSDPEKYAAIIREKNEQVIPMPGFFKQAGEAVGKFVKLYQNGSGRITFIVSTTSHPLVVTL